MNALPQINEDAGRFIAKMLLRCEPPAPAGSPDGGLGILTDEEFTAALHLLQTIDPDRAHAAANVIIATHPHAADHPALATIANQTRPRTIPGATADPSPANGAPPSGKVVRGRFPPPGSHRPLPINHQ